MIRKKAYDYVVVGGGFAGLNAVAGLQKFRPGASILCVDKRPGPGGSWNDYYDFCRLHAPHPNFGVAGHAWGLDDPNRLATRDEVVDHFSTFAFGRGGLDFVGGRRYVGCEEGGVSGGLVATFADGEAVEAGQVITAAGYDYDRHMPRCKDARSDGSDAPEIDARDLSRAAAEDRARDRLYVVVGGGKTGMDAVGYLAERKRSDDDVVLVSGTTKAFFVRDAVFPDQGTQSLFQPMITEVMLDMIDAWDGTAASEVAILSEQTRAGALCVVGEDGGDAVFNTSLGILSLAEKARVEATAKTIFRDDHYVGLSVQGGKTTVKLASGKTLETTKDVVVVNARSSFGDRLHAYSRDVHPMRPDGSLDFGSLVGFTGHTNYLLAALSAKHDPDIFSKVDLYGRRSLAGPDDNFIFAYLLKVYANTTNVLPALGMRNYLDPAYSINATRWYSTARRVVGLVKLLRAKQPILDKANTLLRRLEPGDDQP